MWPQTNTKCKALEQISNALSLDASHGQANLLYGQLLIDGEQYNLALMPLHSAFKELHTIEAAKLLVHTYCRLGMLLDASRVASDIYYSLPSNPDAVSMLAESMSWGDENCRQQAKLKYQEAVSSDPLCISALIGLAELLAREGNTNAALKILEEGSSTVQSPHLECLLGNLLCVMGKHSLALEHFLCASKLNPTLLAATKGVEVSQHSLKYESTVQGSSSTHPTVNVSSSSAHNTQQELSLLSTGRITTTRALVEGNNTTPGNNSAASITDYSTPARQLNFDDLSTSASRLGIF